MGISGSAAVCVRRRLERSRARSVDYSLSRVSRHLALVLFPVNAREMLGGARHERTIAPFVPLIRRLRGNYLEANRFAATIVTFYDGTVKRRVEKDLHTGRSTEKIDCAFFVALLL